MITLRTVMIGKLAWMNHSERRGWGDEVSDFRSSGLLTSAVHLSIITLQTAAENRSRVHKDVAWLLGCAGYKIGLLSIPCKSIRLENRKFVMTMTRFSRGQKS